MTVFLRNVSQDCDNTMCNMLLFYRISRVCVVGSAVVKMLFVHFALSYNFQRESEEFLTEEGSAAFNVGEECFLFIEKSGDEFCFSRF